MLIPAFLNDVRQTNEGESTIGLVLIIKYQ